MSVRYLFVCDGCGKTSEGAPSDQYVHPEPPVGWVWRFGPGLAPPHACSQECWQKVERADDGRIILSCSHEDQKWAEALKPPPRELAQPAVPVEPRKKRPGRPVKKDSLTDLTRRVEKLEDAQRPASRSGT